MSASFTSDAGCDNRGLSLLPRCADPRISLRPGLQAGASFNGSCGDSHARAASVSRAIPTIRAQIQF